MPMTILEWQKGNANHYARIAKMILNILEWQGC